MSYSLKVCLTILTFSLFCSLDQTVATRELEKRRSAIRVSTCSELKISSILLTLCIVKSLYPLSLTTDRDLLRRIAAVLVFLQSYRKKHVSLSILKNYSQRKQEAFAIKLYDLKSSAFFMAKSKATHHSLLTERERFYFIVNGY